MLNNDRIGSNFHFAFSGLKGYYASLGLMILCVLLINLFASLTNGQSNIAYPENAIDSRLRTPMRVDPVSHGLQFQITLGSYPGRGGAGMPITLFYSSKLWRLTHQSTVGGPHVDGMIYPLDSIYRAYYAESSAAGWTSNLDWFLYASGDNPVQTYNSQGLPAGDSGAFMVARRYVRLPDGSKHEMRRDDNVHSATNFSSDGIYYSVDGSRLRTGSEGLLLPDGSRYGGSTLIDRHGNKLSYDYSTSQWTDTLGRSFDLPLPSQYTVGESSTATARDETYNLPGIAGAQTAYTFRWRRLGDVRTDPTQALRSIGDRLSKYTCEMAPSLFSSPIYCGAGLDEDHRLMSTDVFNPVVLHEIVFPDGSFYKFTYNIYGEIDKVVYPTGSYEQFQHGAAPTLSGHFQSQFEAFYAQGNRGAFTRTISADDGGAVATWGYGSGQAGTYPNNVPTRRVTAPDGSYTEAHMHAVKSQDLILYGFDDPRTGMAFDERSYTAGGQILTRKLTEWQTDGQIIYSGSFQMHKTRNPRPAKEVSIIFDQSGNALAQTTTYQYDADLNPTVINRYNYAAVDFYTAQNSPISQIPTGTLARIEETDYLTYNQAYRDRNMTALPTETRIKDAAGNVVAKSQISYDEGAYLEGVTISNAPGWENPNTSVRGLPTTIRSWTDITNNQFVETNTLYDQFGNVRKTWDANDNFSEIQYTDNFTDSVNRNSYAYPTKTISPVPGGNGSTVPFESTIKYDFATGLPVSTTDANGQTSTIEYNDPLLRPTRTIAPNGHQTITEYGPGTTAPTRFVKVRSQIDETKWKEGYSWFDGLGRTVKSQSVDSAGDIFTETEYDNMGRPKKATNPYRTGETKLWTENFYDAAGRLFKVKTPDNAEVETIYGLAAIGTHIGTMVTVFDQAEKQRRSITNALGQLTRVDEPDVVSGSLGTADAPNQPTFYAHDTLNNLTTVSQGVQTRSFTYNSLSRLLSAANPESGTISYLYDNNGNLTQKTDLRGVVTNYIYDALNRVTNRNYSAPPGLPNYQATPNVAYFYDNLPNAKGKLIKVSSSVSTTEYTAFDILGRVTAHKQTTDGTAYTTGYTYNLSGSLIEETYPSGRVVKNILDNDGDLAMVQSRKNQNFGYFNYAKNFTYTSAGAVSSMQLGNGKWESTQFNSRLQPTQIALGTVQNGTDKLKLDYSYGGMNNNGNVQSQTITVPTIGTNQGFTAVQNYTYDSLNRLKSATENIGAQTWSQTFLFDRYGNRNFDVANTTTLGSCSAAQCNPTIHTADNRFTTGQGYTFDLAGNVVTDAEGRSFNYDAENKQNSVSNQSGTVGTYLYDGDGKRVKKVVSGGENTIFVYDALGKLVAEYSNQIAQTPQVSYLTSDHLGSPRITTDANGQVISRRDFHPFGEEVFSVQRTQGLGFTADNTRQKFTSYERDIESNLDFAQARYYSSRLGRFYSVDPENYGASEDDPQSWNGYAYARNNPTIFTDPDGLEVKYCDTSRVCVTLTEKEEKDLFNKKLQGELGNIVKNGKVFNSDGEVIATYVNNNPIQQMLRGARPKLEIWQPIIEAIQPAPVPGGAVVGGIVKVGKVAKIVKITKTAWQGTKASRPLKKMGHAGQHLKDFRKIDPNLSEDDVAKILQSVKDSGTPSPSKFGSTNYEAVVDIGSKSVTVNVNVSSGGIIKTGFPID